MNIRKFTVSGILLVLTVLAFSQQSAGVIGSDQTICYQSAPEILRFTTPPSGGTGSYSYEWERSNNGITYNPISGTTGLREVYSPPVLGRTAWFRCRVKSEGFDPAGLVTNAVQITVIPDLAAGIIGRSQTILPGSAPQPITEISPAGGGSGSFSYRWQSSTDGLRWSNIPGQTESSYSPPELSVTTHYRRWTIDQTCGSVAGNTVTITVKPNTYHYDFVYADRESFLADGWDFNARTPAGAVRNTEQTSGAVVSFDQTAHPGEIWIPVDEGDLWQYANDTRNTLFRDLPSDFTSIRLKIASWDPQHNYQQAGLTLYQDDDTYTSITRIFEGGNKIVFSQEADAVAGNLVQIDTDITNDIYYRIDWDQRTGIVTAYYSADGEEWILIGTNYQWFVNPRLAIVVSGDAAPGDFPEAKIAWAEVLTEPFPPIQDHLIAHPGEVVFNVKQGQTIDDLRTIFIASEYGTALPWVLSQTNGDWIVFPETTNGETEGVLRLGVNNSELSAGTYSGSITISSEEAPDNPVTINVRLIVNPDVPVKVATWKDGKSAAFSLSVDDGDPTAYDELLAVGFRGTYLSNGLEPPLYFPLYYNSGMELGSHLVHHTCVPFPNNILRQVEIVPNIEGITNNTAQPASDLITLAWTCGVSNYRMQAAASDYFLSARAYNVNALEDATPDNFMYLKSYNSREHEPYPPNLLSVVDEAVLQKKWLNLVFHDQFEDDGAVAYAGTQDIWGATIGDVIKYIIQRDRFILTNYDATDPDIISFDASRLSVPGSSYREFETAFGNSDVVTLQIDFDVDRDIESVLVNGNPNEFFIKDIEGTEFLFTNVIIGPEAYTHVEVVYYNENIPRIYLSPQNLSFITEEGTDPLAQTFAIESRAQDYTWEITFENSQPDWISVDKSSGTDDGIVQVEITSTGLEPGLYTTKIIVNSEEAYNSPQTISVKLRVNPEGLLHYDFNYPDRQAMVDDDWSFIAKELTGADRHTEQTTGPYIVSYDQQLHPGVIRIPVADGDIWERANDTKNTLFRALPENWTSIRLKIAAFNPSQNYQQASLALYQDDDNYLQISRIYSGRNQISFSQEITPDVHTFPDASTISSIGVNATEDIYFRLDWHEGIGTIVAYYSLNGLDWLFLGSTDREELTDPRLAIVTGASPGGVLNADIEWAQISTAPLEPLKDEFRVYPSSLVFNITEGETSNQERSLFVYTELGREVQITTSADVDWLSVSGADPETECDINTGIINTSGLAPGVYSGTISINPISDPLLDEHLEIPVSLIVNPAVGVRATNWKDGYAGVMSVTVDDGYDAAFDLLNDNGFQGTYVYYGTVPPVYYPDLYSTGMELGSHLATHPYGVVPDNELRHREIEPNIKGLVDNIPGISETDILTLVWPNAISNQRMQAVAADYFLAARGDDNNELEDVTPANFMNLKFYAHEYDDNPPDLKDIVDNAIAQQKWFIMCLHRWEEDLDDGAINYAAGKDIWVTSVGNVVKYILQRDRFVLSGYDYSDQENRITFNVRRLPIPVPVRRPFVTPLKPTDITTLHIDIPDNRIIEEIFVDNVPVDYVLKNHNSIAQLNVVMGENNQEIRVTFQPNENYEDEGQEGLKRSEHPMLLQNAPNPFSSNTRIEFELIDESQVLLEVYNSSGHKVETIISQNLPAGNYQVEWEPVNQPAGIYYLTLKTSMHTESKRMIIMY